jgi:hypothetical protein
MKELKLFKVYILKKEYFEAHEILEEAWQKIRKSNNKHKLVLRGLINSAVAMELIKRGRDSYHRPWGNFLKYSNLYKGDFLEVALFIKKYAKKFKELNN